MSTETDNDLDTFSSTFFSKAPAPEKPTETEPEPEVEPEEEVEDPVDTDEEVPEAPEDEGEAKPEPKKKNSFQERINELTGKAREAQRERDSMRAELEAIKAKLEETSKPTQKQPDKTVSGPDPEDKNEDGEDKYPLGEFDPNYIRDITRHTLKVERELQRKEDEQAEKVRQAQKDSEVLATEWAAKLGPAQERYPDFHEKGQELFGTFVDLDQAYGEYLAGTIMNLEYGPDVLYYLANHLDEADKIVKSGIQKATIALGRIEAKFADAGEEKTRKVSKAPTPPDRINKGSSVSKPTVSDDTDDLDAFSSKFFKKK